MRCFARLADFTALAVGVLFLKGSHPAQENPRAGGVSPLRSLPRAEKLSFLDAAAKRVNLSGLKGPKATVVVFLSFDCPISTGYCPVLAALAKEYQKRGVAFVGVVGPDEKPADSAKQGRSYGLPFPVLTDDKLRAAAVLQARTTPEAFVLDGALTVCYRGRIDDRHLARLKPKAKVGRQDLREALEDVLAGRPVRVSATPAVGCPLQQPEPLKSGVASAPREVASAPREVASAPRGVASAPREVTYYRDVMPILQKHCQECHRPGQVGPFSLMTYRQAVRWAGDIKEFTHSRRMPPWKPVAGPAFHDERKLTEKEIATLAAWADGGTPAGDPEDAPGPRKFAEGWRLGKPDLVLTMPADFHLAASGSDLYRYFVLPTGLTEDKYLTAVEVHPGNPRVVHHAVLLFDRHGRARKLEAREQEKTTPASADHGPGYTMPLAFAFLPGFLPQGGLGGWAPGQIPRHLPEGSAFFLPRGADVVLQIHYHRNGRMEKDRTSVGLYFARKNNLKRFQGLTVPGQFIFIPAGSKNYRVRGTAILRQDCTLHAVMPHMHLLGRYIKVTLKPPTGPARVLVAVEDWDFNWQETFWFREPIRTPAGSGIEVEGTFDNSEGNPQNPHQPPRTVLAGLATTDEMCVGFLGATADRPGAIRFDIPVQIPYLDFLRIPGFGL